MAKKDIDWHNLGFGYVKTDKRYVSNFKDGAWDDGTLISDDTITISECAGVLQYAQTVFEGLKAYTTEDGHVVCFRPDLNAERLEQSAKRLEMPAFPQDRFVDAIVQTVKANIDYVPPYGSGATLYIRPYMFGTNAVYKTSDVSEQMKPIIIQGFTDSVAESKISALDLAANYKEFSSTIVDNTQKEFNDYGLELCSLVIENISLPQEVEAALDERTKLGVMEDKMGTFVQYQAATALKDAANNPNGNNMAGLGVGLGAGAGLGQIFAQGLSSAQNTPKEKPANTKKCPECGKDIPAGAKFCPECGAKVPANKFCPQCGAKVDANAKFCPECGEKL